MDEVDGSGICPHERPRRRRSQQQAGPIIKSAAAGLHGVGAAEPRVPLSCEKPSAHDLESHRSIDESPGHEGDRNQGNANPPSKNAIPRDQGSPLASCSFWTTAETVDCRRENSRRADSICPSVARSSFSRACAVARTSWATRERRSATE